MVTHLHSREALRMTSVQPSGETTMMKLKVTLFVVFTAVSLGIVVPYANAEERIKVCAEYKNTGKSYHVTANLMRGSELNQKTGSWNYSSFSTYAVIFWAQGQASVIELDWPQISVFGTDGSDQNGYRWELSKNSSGLCW
jgi:hypothetical protein